MSLDNAFGDESMVIIDSSTLTVDWSDNNLNTQWAHQELGDMDSNGTQELVVCYVNAMFGYSYFANFLVFDPISHKMIRSAEISINESLKSMFLINANDAVHGLEIGIVDNKLSLYNSNSFEKLWTSESDIMLAQPVDITNDGIDEIVAFGFLDNWTSNMIIYNAKTGAVEFESSPMNNYVKAMVAADIDNDDVIEIGVITDSGVYIHNGATNTMDWSLDASYPSTIEFGDIFPDTPGTEVIYTNGQGHVHIHNGITHEEISSFTLEDEEYIYTLEVVDMDTDDVPEILLKTAMKLVAIDAFGTILWSDQMPGLTRSIKQNFLCKDINEDGVNEVVFGTSKALFEYRHGAAVPDPKTPCEKTVVTLELSDTSFKLNDPFYLNATVCNSGTENLVNHHVMVLLEIYGQYYCLPSWINLNSGLDSYHYTIPPGGWEFNVVPYFSWPSIEGAASGLMFYSAIVNPAMTELIGDMSRVEFGWL